MTTFKIPGKVCLPSSTFGAPISLILLLSLVLVNGTYPFAKIVSYYFLKYLKDPDMLIIGDFSLSFTEAKTQMAIWAIVAAPLLVSSDLRTISPEMLSILKNKEIIEVNQVFEISLEFPIKF
jgi:hypothetical protein